MKNIIDRSSVEKFSRQFIKQLKNSANLLANYSGTNLDEFLPKAFTNENVSINTFYSTDREHIMLVFLNSSKYSFNFALTSGNIIDVFDVFGRWKKYPGAAFGIENSRNINIKGLQVSGMRPFDLLGQIELFAENLTFGLPYPRKVNVTLDYVMMFSKDIFIELYNDILNFTNRLILTYYNFYEISGEKLNEDDAKTIEYRQYLLNLKEQMSSYFFETRHKETDIDDFISLNPDILKLGLDLTNIKRQVKMKDIHNQFGQDLIPDAIGFDTIKETWTIVDYKLPWKRLIRGSGTIRASVTADITQLQKQLKSYREYFSDCSQREFVNNKYDIDVKRLPPTIGVIGTVDDKNRDEFNEERLDFPTWFKVISYDELFKAVNKNIDFALKLMKEDY